MADGSPRVFTQEEVDAIVRRRLARERRRLFAALRRLFGDAAGDEPDGDEAQSDAA